MKILMVSIFSQHFFNWTEQLEHSGHEVYWLDVFDSNTKVKQIDFVHQIVGWRYKWDYPGRYFVKRKFPKLTTFINRINQRKLATVFEEKLREIKPDVVHSFVMFLSCVPIYEVMKKYSQIKWIYSSWGSDLYFYQNKKKEAADMEKVLPRINYMFSDCLRDHQIGINKGFEGEFLGVFPGGGGFDFSVLNPLMQPMESRNIILIKGYQGKHGRCNTVLKAVKNLKSELSNYKIVVFGANQDVLEYISDSKLDQFINLTVREKIPHQEVLKFMGKAVLCIGNSLSDGMPNTLLEAICMGAFPIQSNPGGATAEFIEDGKNGFLINNPEDSQEIKELILGAVENRAFINQAVGYNDIHIKLKLERVRIQKQVVEKYALIEKGL